MHLVHRRRLDHDSRRFGSPVHVARKISATATAERCRMAEATSVCAWLSASVHAPVRACAHAGRSASCRPWHRRALWLLTGIRASRSECGPPRAPSAAACAGGPSASTGVPAAPPTHPCDRRSGRSAVCDRSALACHIEGLVRRMLHGSAHHRHIPATRRYRRFITLARPSPEQSAWALAAAAVLVMRFQRQE